MTSGNADYENETDFAYNWMPGTSKELNGEYDYQDEADEDRIYEEINYSSVSMQNIFESANIEFRNALKAHITPNGRTKIFNCSFKIYKKSDLIPTVQQYKSGQTVEVKVSSIDDSKRFYVQQASRLHDLDRIENCIQKYVNSWLADLTVNSRLFDELLSFQANTAKFDVILAYSKKACKWRRAILLEKISSCHFDNADEDENEVLTIDYLRSKKPNNYYTFFFIDYGLEELITTPIDDQSLILLPINERIMHGSFALKCQINETSIRIREKYGSMRIENQMDFEKRFAENLLNKRVTLRISSITRTGNDVEATAELFYLPKESEELIASLNETFELNQTLSSTLSLSTRAPKLNCCHYLVALVQAEQKLNNLNMNNSEIKVVEVNGAK